MSTIKHPVGPEKSAVYWRRRLAVIAGLVVVIVLIVLLIVRPGSSAGRAPDVTQSPSATPVGTPTVADSASTPASTPTPTAATIDDASTTDPGKAKACTENDIRVDAATDASSYAAGVLPQLTLSVTNTGSKPCTMNAGTSQQVFTITSGTEVYWTSTDCQTASTDQQVLLEPGKTVQPNPPISWDRTRSAPDTCAGDRPQVPAGGASYHLQTSIAGFTSEDSAQFLLN